MLCGKAKCPILVKFYSRVRTKPLIDKTFLEGSSPPGVFVGRMGYPYVYLGPLIPPVYGDTSLLDTPELWLGKEIEEIVDFRFQLVRGMHRVYIKDVESANKIVRISRELTISKASADVDAEFLKRPKGPIIMSEGSQPFGPSAPIKDLDVSSLKTDWKIEKAYYDTDLKAKDAVLGLYKKEVLISKIQKAFSMGTFGLGKNRRFVPTRWSITAVDSTVSKELVEKLKDYPLINEYLIFESVHLDNRWLVILMPHHWSYELIEAWYPETLWNPSKEIAIYSSAEGYEGRTTYAEIGGCYYAARLAISEYLNKIRRQASALILRETHSGYIMPVGVWNVRESVRDTLKNKPLKFNSLEEVLKHISSKLDIKIKTWIEESELLQEKLFQKRLKDFCGGNDSK
jgi:hypothetical protein